MNWFRNCRTTVKLLLGFVSVLCLAAIIGYEGITKLAVLEGRLTLMYDRDFLGLSEIKESAASQLKCGRLMRNAVIATGNREEVENNIQKMEEEFSRVHAHLAKAEPKFVTVQGKAALANITAQLVKYESVCKSIGDTARSGDFKAAREHLKQASALTDSMLLAYDAAARQKEQFAENTKTDTTEVYLQARTTLILLAVSTVTIGMLIGYLIARTIAKPLLKAVSVLEGVATGDLTHTLDVDTRDEIGAMATALNTAIASVSTILQKVKLTANDLTVTSQQLAGGSSALSAGTLESTASLEETSASLEQITATVRQNSESAKQASALTAVARETASNGGSVVGEAISAMAEINDSSRRISDIISSMDDITFQTNLLAVNAAIEAAHAGEQGRGFAVVAEEVRALAQRSATASKQIKTLITDSVNKVEAGSEFVNRSGDALKDIIESVKRAAEIVGEISAACSEQATGIAQVNTAVNQMNVVAQSSGEKTERVSYAAQRVSQQAAELKSMLVSFVLPEA